MQVVQSKEKIISNQSQRRFIQPNQMSVAFAARGNRPALSPAQVQKMLDENAHLIQTIQEYQSKGQLMESHQYQQMLHRNLVYLSSVADANQNIQLLLPPPHQLATGNMPPGPPVSGSDLPGPSQQAYRPIMGVSTTPTRPTQSYGQRPYPQNQYQGQYQGAPGYPPQGPFASPAQGYGPPTPSQQPQGYSANSSYGPSITTTPSNYPPSTHTPPGYPPSSGQQPYAPPPVSSAGSGSPYPVRGPPGYGGNSAYPPQAGPNYAAGVSAYNSTPPQTQPYQSQPFPNTTPGSAYSSAPISQPIRSPQPPSGFAGQPPPSSNYGSTSAQSPTYNSSSHSNNAPPASVASGAPSAAGGPPGTGQQYPPPGQQSYPPAAQSLYSNTSSQSVSPAPPVSTAPPQQSYSSPQSYSPSGGAYPPHAYQQGYPPAQYPPSPYPYARGPAPGAPPSNAPQPYPGYGFQPPAQQ